MRCCNMDAGEALPALHVRLDSRTLGGAGIFVCSQDRATGCWLPDDGLVALERKVRLRDIAVFPAAEVEVRLAQVIILVNAGV